MAERYNVTQLHGDDCSMCLVDGETLALVIESDTESAEINLLALSGDDLRTAAEFLLRAASVVDGEVEQ